MGARVITSLTQDVCDQGDSVTSGLPQQLVELMGEDPRW
jgi:hypothetical protein